MSARVYRRKARILAIVILAILLVLGATLAGTLLQSKEVVKDQQAIMEEQVEQILNGDLDMTIQISEAWGKQATQMMNRIRAERNLKPLRWSNHMHTVAYQRCKEIATGLIPFDKSNLMNLLQQTRSFYEPNYVVPQMSEQL